MSHKRHCRNDRKVTALGYYGEAGSPAMSMVNHTDADCVLVWEAVEVGSMALGF
ncbi:MAG: hypothetical protein LBS00_00975 [Synergistaceae bacterium]|nr:hypothetical protein [Synergistaceae bacterium]